MSLAEILKISLWRTLKHLQKEKSNQVCKHQSKSKNWKLFYSFKHFSFCNEQKYSFNLRFFYNCFFFFVDSSGYNLKLILLKSLFPSARHCLLFASTIMRLSCYIIILQIVLSWVFDTHTAGVPSMDVWISQKSDSSAHHLGIWYVGIKFITWK